MQFRGYQVDAVHRTVTSPSGRMVRLEPKAFDLLAYFAEHPNETLTRDRLIEDVWGGKFVTEDAVMVAVYALRQAFEDDSRAPRFLETIRGRGYRWIATASTAQLPKRPRYATALLAAIALSGIGALVWASLRQTAPMPSLQQTNALLRAHARGVFFSERATRHDLEEARVEFRKAIVVDRRFAEPHAALAEVCVRLIEVGDLDVRSREAEARRELREAMELGPQLAFTQAALASVQFVLDRDTARAEQSFRHAMELDPSLPDTHRRYSYLLSATGRFAEAADQARIAADMQPASVAAINDYAWTQILSGRLDEAERLYRDSLRLDPSNISTLLSLGNCLEMRGEAQAAMQLYRKAMEVRGVPAAQLAKWDRTFAASGLAGVYADWVDQLKAKKDVPRFAIATFAVRAGRTAEALDLLRESVQRHEAATLWLGVHPAFAPLRGQREFAMLVASSFHTR